MINLTKTNTVQLHPATDEWMSGDKYGSIRARRVDGSILIRLDKSDKLKWFHRDDIYEEFTR